MYCEAVQMNLINNWLCLLNTVLGKEKGGKADTYVFTLPFTHPTLLF